MILNYQEETSHNINLLNEKAVTEASEFYSNIMGPLQEFSVSPVIVCEVIKGLSKIASGSKYGKVWVDIENGIATFVRSEEVVKTSEQVIVQASDNYKTNTPIID